MVSGFPRDTPMIQQVSVVSLFLIPGFTLVWWAISLICRRTAVIFDKPPGHITVTRGHISPLLWFLRRKCISKKEARTVFFRTFKQSHGYSDSVTGYQMGVNTESGKELIMHNSYWNLEGAQTITEKIREFANQESAVSDSTTSDK